MKHSAKKIMAILGLICGAVILILGIRMMGEYTGAWRDTSIAFGADFYTESYRAMASAANNVQVLCGIAAKGFGYLLIALGLTDLCFFGWKLVGLVSEKPEADPVPMTPEKPVCTSAPETEPAPEAEPEDAPVQEPEEQPEPEELPESEENLQE